MENNEKKNQFLQLQFCTLMVICTLLPDLGSVVGSITGLGSDIDIPVIICRVIGVVGAGLALYNFYNKMGVIPPVYLGVIGGGLTLALISIIPNVGDWIEYVALIALLVAFFIAKKNLSIKWNTFGGEGAYIILLSVLLHVYYGIDDKMLAAIAALIGLIVYFKGLLLLRQDMDANGCIGVSRLKTAIQLGIISVVIGFIPLLGSIVAGILGIIAFIFEFMGYSALKESGVIQDIGREGAGKLRLSMIIAVIATVIGFIPLMGIVEGILNIIALWFVFKGWTMIFKGLENRQLLVVE